MNERKLRDFDLDDDAPGTVHNGRSEPIIIVQYRTRLLSGVLVPPALILAVPALWVWTAPSLADLAQFALLGTLGVVAHTMLAHAFARIEAARLAPVTYVTLVWGVLFGFLFFAEVPGVATFAGAALIVFGTILTRR